MKKIKLFFVFVLILQAAVAQKEWSNWYYDGRNMITFKNGYAQLVTNFINPLPPPTDWLNFYSWGSGGISYSDPVTGDMKFIISSRVGFDRTFNDFPNDTFVRSCPDIYSYHIIPFGNNPNKFYVVQFQDASADILAQESGLQVVCPNAIGLGYSIVDLNLNNGLGDFHIMNQVVGQGYSGQITTVKHANGKDVWVIVHPHNTAQYQSFLFTGNGVQPAVVSNIGAYIGGGFASVFGALTASHDGKLLAGYTSLEKNVQLFDFNNSTGILSNYRTMLCIGSASKLQFSPDNTKLYYLNDAIYQYDFNQSNVAASLTKVYETPINNFYNMQLAPDGKIYVPGFYVLINGNYETYTGTIECPNLPQFACNINTAALNTSAINLPNLINDFINEPHAPAITKFDIGRDTSICFGNYTITAPNGWQSYKWSTGETTKQITVTKPGTYSVLTGNTGFSCPAGYGYIIVGDKAKKLDLGRDTTLCPGVAYTIHVDDNYSNIIWQNVSTSRDSIITSSTGLVISANDRNGCFTKDSINIYFKQYPQASFGSDTTLCNDETLHLQLEPNKNFPVIASYTWQDSSHIDTYTVTVPGTYWGRVSYDGCTISDTINVSYVNAANATLGNDTTLCEGDSLQLKVNIANARYLWNTLDTTQAIIVKAGGTYSVSITNGICTQTDTVVVGFKYVPGFTLGNDTAMCNNNSLTLDEKNTFGTYLWQDGNTAPAYTISNAGLYWLQITQNGCSFKDSIIVTHKNIPAINLGKDTGICEGKQLRLNAFNTDFTNYYWQDASINSLYNATLAGRYSVKVTGSNGCQNSDTILVTTTAPPAFSLGTDTVLCDTKTLAFNFNITNATYLWNTGSQSNNYNITTPNTYSLTITQLSCSKSDTITVNYKPLPVIDIGKDTTLCESSTQLLNAANPGASYVWQDNSTLASQIISKPGNYFVKVILNGCEVIDSINIQYKNKPRFFLGNDTFLCRGQQLVLKPFVKDGGIYFWQDRSTLDNFKVSDPGTYRLSVTNICGSKTDEIIIKAGLCSLEIPNSFTPNNDGLNDFFRVKYPEFIKQFNMVVYNRWGQKIFATTNPQTGWDGSFKGIQQPASAYTWTIQLIDFENHTKAASGSILLIR